MWLELCNIICIIIVQFYMQAKQCYGNKATHGCHLEVKCTEMYGNPSFWYLGCLK